MRLEDQGKEVKKSGFLRGTRMWTVRNRILIGSAVFIGMFYTYWIVYAEQNRDKITARIEEKRAEVRENELRIAERTKAFKSRHMKLQQESDN